MRPPPLAAVVERRLLVNYRTDPEAVARLLPAPLRPQIVAGYAVGGVCLIRLGRLRLDHLPGLPGLRSENAAHRIAVEWDTPDGVAVGVYIPRRDTNSLASVVAGGRLFPGEHHRARFVVDETDRELRVGFQAADRSAAVQVHVRLGRGWTPSVLFATLDEASEFFRRGAAGYSATRSGECLDGLELRSERFRLEPAEVAEVSTSFFDDPARFPPGTATVDSALLLRDTPVTWNPLPAMRLSAVGGRRG